MKFPQPTEEHRRRSIERQCRMLRDQRDAARAERDRLRTAIQQHRDDYAFAVSPASKTREQMNRRKRAANEALWAALDDLR